MKNPCKNVLAQKHADQRKSGKQKIVNHKVIPEICNRGSSSLTVSCYQTKIIPELSSGYSTHVVNSSHSGITRSHHTKLVSSSSRCQTGFTLIELLVVVLIIGILAAVALPQYQKAVVKSRLSTLKHLVETTANAAETYYLATNDYPKQFDELDINFPLPTSYTWQDESGWGTGSGYGHANYDWGQCSLFWSPNHSNNFTQCNHTQAGIGYAKRFAYSNADKNGRNCIAHNEIALSVCLQETGTYRYACNHYNTTPETWVCPY